MTESVLVLADPDRRYTEAFLSYAAEYASKWSLEIRVFSRFDLLLSYLEERRPALLLISEKMMSADIARDIGDRADCPLVLTEGQRQSIYDAWASICKYQSVPNLLRRAMKKYAAGRAAERDKPVLKGDMTVVGFYSPLGGCLQTSLAVAFGSLIAAKRPCLLLDMEGSSGFSGIMGRHFDKDLSDLMGDIADGKAHLPERLQLLTHTVGALDYLPPVSVSQDIFEAPLAILRRIVTMICENTPYETLVMDLGSGAPGLLELLMLCDVVYVPAKDDHLSEEKLREFMKSAALWDKALADKLKLLPISALPPCGLSVEEPARLAEGILGQFMREQGLSDSEEDFRHGNKESGFEPKTQRAAQKLP